jgi:hypothetical protein
MKRRVLWFTLAFLFVGILSAIAQDAARRSRPGTPACVPPACWTGNFYQYEIVAQTGESVQIGSINATLTGFGISPSISEFGAVAFVGQVSDSSGTALGDTLFFGDPGSTSLNVVAPSFLSTSRTFDDAVQINDSNQLVAQDRVSGAPPYTYVRIWDGGNPDHFTLVAQGPGRRTTNSRQC